MGLDATHPLYPTKANDWIMVRDFYEGEGKVKGKTVTYLPAAPSMILDGMGMTGSTPKLGQATYNAYIQRAVFADYVRDAVEAYLGLLHQKDATIELPPEMEDMREKATLHGESLSMLLRRINEEQLITGRLGLLLDLPANPDQTNPVPYIALYIAESIRNWDDGEINEGPTKLNLVVLDESSDKRQADFTWQPVSKYRVLMLGSNVVTPAVEALDGAAAIPAVMGPMTYQVGVFQNEGTGSPVFVASDMLAPTMRGATLDQIPFVFVNTKDIVAAPDMPPLLGLARMCKAIYQGEADLRQNLFMQGQDTLVIVGDRKKKAGDSELDESAIRVGAGSVIELDVGGTAEYVGVTANGLSEQRQTIAEDRNRAEARSGQLISAKENGVESGAALKTRVSSQTATLNQIAKTGAAALEHLLRIAAEWRGLDPKKVKVAPNLEFSDMEMTGENLSKLMAARSMGAPLSKQSIHALMADQGLTKLDYESEKDLIAEEDASDPRLLGTTAGGNPADPNAPPKPGAPKPKPGAPAPAPKLGAPKPKPAPGVAE